MLHPAALSEPVCPFSTDHPSIVLEIVNQRICPRQLADCAKKKSWMMFGNLLG